jgi:hypothetical protein
MSSRKIRRAAAHATQKLDRKAGFPTEQQPTNISAAQFAANRANAQHSTGPVTSAGRAASSQNHTTHGLARHNGHFRILPTEDLADFEALKAGLAAEHQPTTVTESILLNTMAESHWLANRAQRLADCCCDQETGLVDQPQPFNLYLRYQSNHRRAFHKALNDLLKLRAERRKAEVGFEAQKCKAEENEIKNQFAQQDLAWQDPTFRADCNRLGLASLNKGPEYDRLKAEFAAKYWPKSASNEGATAQAAA